MTKEGQWKMSVSLYGPECIGFHYTTLRKPGISAEVPYYTSARFHNHVRSVMISRQYLQFTANRLL
jgi:hypothetical protein